MKPKPIISPVTSCPKGKIIDRWATFQTEDYVRAKLILTSRYANQVRLLLLTSIE